MKIKHRMMDTGKKLVFTFCKMFENVRLLADLHSEFAKFADFFMNLSQRGQCILFSVIFTPSPPSYQGSVWVLRQLSHLN
jgi:hypothetical protein